MLPYTAGSADGRGHARRALTRQPVDDDLILCLAGHSHRNDLLGEVSGSVGRPGAAMALVGKAVLILARKCQLGRNLAALRRHRHRKILIPETVVDHRVDDRVVAETISPTRAAEQIRRVRHRLHTAGRDHRVRSGVDGTHRVDHREQPRSAHFVDGIRGHGLGQTRFEKDLPRGILPDAGLQHFAERDVLDLAGVDAPSVRSHRPAQRRPRWSP